MLSSSTLDATVTRRTDRAYADQRIADRPAHANSEASVRSCHFRRTEPSTTCPTRCGLVRGDAGAAAATNRIDKVHVAYPSASWIPGRSGGACQRRFPQTHPPTPVLGALGSVSGGPC